MHQDVRNPLLYYACFRSKRVYENVRLCRIKTSEHQMGHGQVDPRLARLLRPLVVLAQPTIPAQPRERPLHDPTPRQHLELLRLTFLRLGTDDQLENPAPSLLRPLRDSTVVDPIGQDLLQPGEPANHLWLIR